MSSSRGVRPQRAAFVARLLVCAALLVPVAAVARGVKPPGPPPSHLPPRLEVRGDQLSFYPYSNATLLAAEGHVRLRAGRRQIAADSLRLDLKANKLIATGNVIVSGAGNTLYLTAYALDLTTDKAEVIRLDPTPRTLAISGDNLSGAIEGPAPSDTFGMADLTGQRPYIQSKRAVITTNANIRMSPAEFPTGTSAMGVLPTFVYTYQYNQLLGQGQALPTTTIDYPYTLFGTPNSLTALHARYGQNDGVELGVDERLVDGNREYVVGSVLPFRGRRIDLNAYQAIDRTLQQNFTGEFAKNVAVGYYSIQETAREFSLRGTTSVYNGENTSNVTLGTVNARLFHAFSYQLLAGYGYDHNPGQSPFAGDFHKDFSAQFTRNDIDLSHGVSASLQYNYGLTKYDTPHVFVKNIETLGLSSPAIRLSRGGARSLRFFGSVSIENDAALFRDDFAQFLYLPDPSQLYFAPDGTLDPGYFAYNGITTLRTYAVTTTYQGPRDFRFQLTLSHQHDFPQGHGIGRPPLTAYGDLTMRVTSSLKAEIGRTYSFGINGQRYSQYSFSISP